MRLILICRDPRVKHEDDFILKRHEDDIHNKKRRIKTPPFLRIAFLVMATVSAATGCAGASIS